MKCVCGCQSVSVLVNVIVRDKLCQHLRVELRASRISDELVQFEIKSLKIDEVGAVCRSLEITRETNNEMLSSGRDIKCNIGLSASEWVIFDVSLDSSDGVTFVFVRRKFDSDHVFLGRELQPLLDRQSIVTYFALNVFLSVGE